MLFSEVKRCHPRQREFLSFEALKKFCQSRKLKTFLANSVAAWNACRTYTLCSPIPIKWQLFFEEGQEPSDCNMKLVETGALAQVSRWDHPNLIKAG
jgi:hypothetical protein